MCKAVEDWAEELLTEGEAKGRAEGKEEGIITTLADLVKNGIITVIQAAEQATVIFLLSYLLGLYIFVIL